MSRPWVRWAAAVVAGLAVLAAVSWVLGPGIEWWMRGVDGVQLADGVSAQEKDALEARDKARGRIVAYGTGILAALAIWFTASNATSARRTADAAQRTAEASEQGLVTGRYTAATDQLGSDKLDIRLGGVYALERVARDSARDHSTVMAVLAAFVREHSHDEDAHTDSRQLPFSNAGDLVPPVRTRFRFDLQAALSVIARRTVVHDIDPVDLSGANLTDANLIRAFLDGAELTGAQLSGVYLTDAYLSGASLVGADLTRADLSDADASGAFLNSANLTGANLTRGRFQGALLIHATLAGAFLEEAAVTGAHLHNADVSRAVLRKADLRQANLSGANLTGSDLTGADLTDANLNGANLTDANLRGVRGLSEEQIREAAGSVNGARFGPLEEAS
ncbi:pentapeptide repeat-containing protein [Thermomonospora umbrina]|uniref:pentapeptide repeat-containing protein n=1 Tax=Thermomonospora umbrina TaxID=111806 RepID=UPI0011C0F4D6|nr:pentapeptide repeat-containing protein [Thermomonospora umbrina]